MRVWTFDGRTPRTIFSVQKPTRSRKELFDDEKKEQRRRRFKVAYPWNGGTLRWNVIATCFEQEEEDIFKKENDKYFLERAINIFGA